MGHDKRYDGYAAFGYLEAGTDYESFELAEADPGPDAEPVPLSPAEEERVSELTADTVLSLHDHPIRFPADIEGDLRDYVRAGRGHTDYAALAETPLDAVFDMHLDGLSGIHSTNGWKWEDIVHDVSMRACDIAHSEYAFRCTSLEDVHRARETGRLAIVPALESAAMIENELDRIEQLYGMGVRSMGLTYEASNALGAGKGDDSERDGGLTAFGAEAIERMNAVGMAVSISHASRRTTLDACALADAPVFDTHTMAAGGPGAGGATDEELEAVADTGGVIGVVSAIHLDSLADHMAHFEHVVDRVGIEHVAFGPDVLYGDHTALLGALAATRGVDLPAAFLESRHVDGLRTPTQAWRTIPRLLVKHGYSDAEIRGVLGGNVLRALEAAW